MVEKIFECDITFQNHGLAFRSSTMENIRRDLADLEKYPGAHAPFDAIDPQGEVAQVYLFQKNGRLFARGAKHTTVLRNPENLYEFLERSRRVKKITLAYRS